MYNRFGLWLIFCCMTWKAWNIEFLLTKLFLLRYVIKRTRTLNITEILFSRNIHKNNLYNHSSLLVYLLSVDLKCLALASGYMVCFKYITKLRRKREINFFFWKIIQMVYLYILLWHLTFINQMILSYTVCFFCWFFSANITV